jgi:hypothetical protein
MKIVGENGIIEKAIIIRAASIKKLGAHKIPHIIADRAMRIIEPSKVRYKSTLFFLVNFPASGSRGGRRKE